FQAEDGIRDFHVTGVQTCALPIWLRYSLSDSSVSIDIAHKLGEISRSLNCVGQVSKKSARLPLASTSATSVRLPRCAARRASERSEERRVGKQGRPQRAAAAQREG